MDENEGERPAHAVRAARPNMYDWYNPGVRRRTVEHHAIATDLHCEE